MKYHILLGSNKGDSHSLIEQSKKMLSEKNHTIISQSSFYKTEPWGKKTTTRFFKPNYYHPN